MYRNFYYFLFRIEKRSKKIIVNLWWFPQGVYHGDTTRCILSLRKRYSSIPHGASPLPVRVQVVVEEEKAKKRKKRNGEVR